MVSRRAVLVSRQSSVVSRRAATSTSDTPCTRQGCGLSSRPAYAIADEPEQRRRAAEDFFCEELEAWRKAMGIERMVCPHPKPKPKPKPNPNPNPNPDPRVGLGLTLTLTLTLTIE